MKGVEMLSRFKQWFSGLSRRKQNYVGMFSLVTLLFVMDSSPLAPYFMSVVFFANLLFWIGAALIFIVAIFVWALMAGK